jgi:hypothetical protein
MPLTTTKYLSTTLGDDQSSIPLQSRASFPTDQYWRSFAASGEGEITMKKNGKQKTVSLKELSWDRTILP